MIRWKFVVIRKEEWPAEKGEDERGKRFGKGPERFMLSRMALWACASFFTRQSARNELRCTACISCFGCSAAVDPFLSVSLSARTRTSLRDGQPKIRSIRAVTIVVVVAREARAIAILKVQNCDWRGRQRSCRIIRIGGQIGIGKGAVITAVSLELSRSRPTVYAGKALAKPEEEPQSLCLGRIAGPRS